jgi:hypothetical protein
MAPPNAGDAGAMLSRAPAAQSSDAAAPHWPRKGPKLCINISKFIWIDVLFGADAAAKADYSWVDPAVAAKGGATIDRRRRIFIGAGKRIVAGKAIVAFPRQSAAVYRSLSHSFSAGA